MNAYGLIYRHDEVVELVTMTNADDVPARPRVKFTRQEEGFPAVDWYEDDPNRRWVIVNMPDHNAETHAPVIDPLSWDAEEITFTILPLRDYVLIGEVSEGTVAVILPEQRERATSEPAQAPNKKRRFVLDEPPTFDPGTQYLVVGALSLEIDTLPYSVADYTEEEVSARYEQAHPRLKLKSANTVLNLIRGVIGVSRFRTMWNDSHETMQDLRIQVLGAEDMDPGDMSFVFGAIASVNAEYITEEEAAAIMQAWPRKP